MRRTIQTVEELNSIREQSVNERFVKFNAI